MFPGIRAQCFSFDGEGEHERDGPAYVVKIYQDAATRRRNEFFELMGFIDSSLPIATKIASVYRLREFPEHKDFIIRFCESQRNNIEGGGSHFLIAEMDATAAFFRKP